MAKFVIHKTSRCPAHVSYIGPTWDNVGIRHLRKDVYEDYSEAEKIAQLLTKENPVGFSVSEVVDG